MFLLQSTFQTLQLTANAEIEPHNQDLFVIGENTLTVSVTQAEMFHLFISLYTNANISVFLFVSRRGLQQVTEIVLTSLTSITN